MIVHLIPEGRLEETAARRIIEHCGHSLGRVFNPQGAPYLKDNVHRYRSLARGAEAVLVLTDFMDSRAACPPLAVQQYLLRHVPNPPQQFLLRFAVRELESWMLADRIGFAAFFHVAQGRIPGRPEEEVDPKRTVVNLARRSRSEDIRREMVPGERHGGVVGPGYTALMQEYARDQWDIDRARLAAPSLDRCLLRVMALRAD